MSVKDICKEGGKEMKNATLMIDLADNKMDDFNELVKRLKILAKSNYGVLSGSMIWLEVLQHLGVNAEKEILEAFNISDLKTKIYGIKTLKLIAVNTATHCAFLLFKIDENAQKKCCDISSAAMHLAEIYEDINSLEICSGIETNIRFKTGAKIAATITTDWIRIESSKDNLIYSIIIPICELDASIDMTILLETAIKKMMN